MWVTPLRRDEELKVLTVLDLLGKLDVLSLALAIGLLEEDWLQPRIQLLAYVFKHHDRPELHSDLNCSEEVRVR